MKPATGASPDPWGAWRVVLKILWTAFSAMVAYLITALVSWRHAAMEYCEPSFLDPLLGGCWPSFEEKPWAHVEAWALGLGLLALLAIPVWEPLWARFRRRPTRP